MSGMELEVDGGLRVVGGFIPLPHILCSRDRKLGYKFNVE